MMSCRENLQKCHEYVRALEEERRKIQMFEKELPLCLEIITQAIESCKLQLPGTVGTATTTTTTTDCSEQTTSDGLVFEEFIPITREGEEEDNSQLESHKNDKSQKSDWLRSAQLWNQSADPPTREKEEGEKNSRLQVRKVSVVEVTQSNPTEIIVTPTSAVSEMEAAAAPLEAPAGSSCSSGSKRKSRRCWSLELHRRFLNALEQLGGPHVATPKQIRKLMKVDGLTNDEVKSHLQKYRLHSTRRPTTSHHNSINSNSTQAGPQFVVVGGIWVPPSNTSSMDGVTTGGASGVVYAPLGQQQPRHQVADIDINDNNINKGGRCNSSPANSSSARAATASPAC